MFEKLPETLKKDAGFILWRYEEQKGRITKVPYKLENVDYAVMLANAGFDVPERPKKKSRRIRKLKIRK